VFAFDLLEFLPVLNDYSKVLELMATQVLDAIAGQKPPLLEPLQSLKRKLTTPTKFGALEPPVSTRTPFDQIAKRLSDLWRQEDAFHTFFSAALQLPIHVARAAGLETVVVVVDNIDHADLQLSPHPPFVWGDEYLFLVELLKYTIDSCNFVVACEDTDRFLHSMAPTDDDGIDLLAGMHLVSTADIGEANAHADRFAVDIDGDDLPLVLHSSLCGGVIHFLMKWKGLCDLVNRLESCPQGDEFDDVQFSAINAAQEFVNLVFSPIEPNDEIHVANVVRLSEATEF
jgi:hypothetical protein